MKLCTVLLFICLLVSCRNEKKNPYAEESDNTNTAAPTQRATNSGKIDLNAEGPIILPDACTLVSVSEISKIFSVDEAAINVKDGNPNGEDVRSCFFRWTSNETPNTGVLIQIMRNPRADEYPEWPILFIDSKKLSGEQKLGSDQPMIFEKFEDVGDDGAYSYEAGKCYWRIKDKLVFMIAFNLDLTKRRQLRAAKSIADIVMDNV